MVHQGAPQRQAGQPDRVSSLFGLTPASPRNNWTELAKDANGPEPGDGRDGPRPTRPRFRATRPVAPSANGPSRGRPPAYRAVPARDGLRWPTLMRRVECPSDSLAQRDAEIVIIAALSTELGTAHANVPIPTGTGGRVEVDGAFTDLTILVEAHAHQGALRGGQSNKLASDALELTGIGGQVAAERLILALADERVEAYLRRPRAWFTQALIDFGVEVIRVELDDASASALVAAQTVQYR